MKYFSFSSLPGLNRLLLYFKIVRLDIFFAENFIPAVLGCTLLFAALNETLVAYTILIWSSIFGGALFLSFTIHVLIINSGCSVFNSQYKITEDEMVSSVCYITEQMSLLTYLKTNPHANHHS